MAIGANPFGALFGYPNNDDQEKRGQHDFGREARQQGIAIERMVAIAV